MSSSSVFAADPPELAPGRRLANFRDLGGLPAASGRTRGGVLYRSDAPYPGDLAPIGAPEWPPAVVIDLRSSGETTNSFPWPASTEVHHLPLLAEAAPALQTGTLESLYQHILTAVPTTLASIAGIVANATGPVLIHCSAGKDRTGVSIALILLAVGVHPSAIVYDYAATAPNVAGALERMQALGYDLPIRSTLPAHLLETPREAMEQVLATLISWPGGTSGWLVDHGMPADDLPKLTARLITTL